jgi:catechol 2,3-dioxygenase-like lactoylglutathione lyase family enzyme
MDQRVSLITLGVADVDVARRFYERLGWRVGLDVQETVFFQAGDMIVGLWGRDRLAADSGVSDGGGWGGITLAHNVHSDGEVDRVIEEARVAGARITREPPGRRVPRWRRRHRCRRYRAA